MVMGKNFMHNNKGLFWLLAATLFVAACGSPSSQVVGRWQLSEYCYGTDCISVEDFGHTQVLELVDTPTDINSESCPQATLRRGVLFQEPTEKDILWTLNANSDSLYLFDADGTTLDIMYVTELEHDTLILSSMLYNILIRQRYERINP